MTDVDKLLRNLSVASQADVPGPIDVRQRVLQTLSGRPQPARVDLTPVAFASLAVAIAAAVVIAFLPAWHTMSDPWVGLLP